MEQEFHYVRQNPEVYSILAECYLIYISNITKNVKDDYKILYKKVEGRTEEQGNKKCRVSRKCKNLEALELRHFNASTNEM